VTKLLALALIPVMLAGCGGGGGSSTVSTTPPSGGGTGGTATIATAGPPNVEPLVIDGGPAGLPESTANVAYVTITVCVPGSTTQCQSIDHVEIDTGSVGLRLLASALTSVTLPGEGDGAGNLLGECLEFVDNTTAWGEVVQADVQLPVSGETTASTSGPALNVQLIGAAATGATPPAGCTGTPQDTVDAFGANGVLGVGSFGTDCNDGPCAPGNTAGYYSCPSSGAACAAFTASEAQQLQNPVTLFAKDNNGSIVELPAIAAAGATDPSGGVIVFGIGTESNNAIGTATELMADVNTGQISATYNGATYPSSYLDSGSNANFVTGSGAAECTDIPPFLCPTATLSENATLTGSNTSATAYFTIANADSLFSTNPHGTAFNDVGAAGFDSQSLDLGLPFFFGQNVYLGIETETVAPFYAVIAN
jgi:hypothetical protein